MKPDEMAFLKLLVKEMGAVKVAQLLILFMNTVDSLDLIDSIEQLILTDKYEYDKVTDQIKYYGGPKYKDDVIRRRIAAFWIVASFGYENVREILPLRYPMQLLFISNDNVCYDITVCEHNVDATTSVRVRKLYAIQGEPDDVKHIIIVKNEEIGRKVIKYGFDCFCILGSDFTPRYYYE